MLTHVKEIMSDFISMITTFGDLTIDEKKKDPEVYYCYGAILKSIEEKENRITKIKFQGIERCFWYNSSLENTNIGIGDKVNITYKKEIVRTYTHFWIISISLCDEETSFVIRRTKKIKDESLDQFIVNCEYCNEGKVRFTSFQRCEGKLFKNNCDIIQCQKCKSQFGGNIGGSCIREYGKCSSCLKTKQI